MTDKADVLNAATWSTKTVTKTSEPKTKESSKPKAVKFDARADAVRLEEIASTFSYVGHAATKQVLNEIAMRLATGAYSTK